MSECKHGYTSVLGAHRLICPYCEITRLDAELAQAKEATDNYWYDRYQCVVERAEQAERERGMLLAAVEASENEKKQYRRESDRYREALEKIMNHQPYYDPDKTYCEVTGIAREALKEL